MWAFWRSIFFDHSLSCLYTQIKAMIEANIHRINTKRTASFHLFFSIWISFKILIYWFLAVLGLCCCAWAFSEVKWNHSVVSNSLRSHGLQPTRLLHPWYFPGKSTGVGCHFLLQGVFPPQGSNPGLLHCRKILYQLSYQGSLEKSMEIP